MRASVHFSYFETFCGENAEVIFVQQQTEKVYKKVIFFICCARFIMCKNKEYKKHFYSLLIVSIINKRPGLLLPP